MVYIEKIVSHAFLHKTFNNKLQHEILYTHIYYTISFDGMASWFDKDSSQCVTQRSGWVYCPIWRVSSQPYFSFLCMYSISLEICTRFCCALLCCGDAIGHNEFTWSIYPYSSGLLCGTVAIVRLPQCQWSKPDGYGKISQCITTTKHSKAKTVCIFLGIYCTYNTQMTQCGSKSHPIL